MQLVSQIALTVVIHTIFNPYFLYVQLALAIYLLIANSFNAAMKSSKLCLYLKNYPIKKNLGFLPRFFYKRFYY